MKESEAVDVTVNFENGFSVTLQKVEVLFVPGKQAHDYAPASERWILGYTGIEVRLVESLIHALKFPVMRPIAVGKERLCPLEADLRKAWSGSETHGRDDDHGASTEIYSVLTSIAAMT